MSKEDFDVILGYEEHHGELKPIPGREAVTFGMIADFIAERTPIRRMALLDVLGTRCAPAGAFRSIQETVDLRARTGGAFGPSTPILKRVRGIRLAEVWNQLRWLSRGRLPELLPNFLHSMIGCAVQLVGLAAMLGACITIGLAFGAATGIVSAVIGVVLLVSTVHALHRLTTKLPPGFTTFRDVALAMAGGIAPRRAADGGAE